MFVTTISGKSVLKRVLKEATCIRERERVCFKVRERERERTCPRKEDRERERK